MIIILLSVSFSQKNSLTETKVKSKDHSNIDKVKSDPITIWEDEDKYIDNPELKMEMENLRKEFESKRTSIQNNYKAKIKVLREQSHSEIELLRKDLVAKRNAIKKKYGVKKPKKIKNNKNNKIDPVNKPKVFNQPSGVKPVKISSINKDLDDNSKKKPVKVPDKDKK